MKPARFSVPPLGASISPFAFSIVLLAVWAVSVVPLGFSTYPPLLDYATHIARMYVLAHWDEVEFFRQVYNPPHYLIPNIGMDVVVLALSKILPVELAGRLFISLVLLVTLSGSAFLYWSLQRRLTLWPLVSAAFLYNWILIYGFLNYLLGVGLMLWGLGAWIGTRDATPARRIATGAAFGLAIFFCHVSAFGLFALAVGGYELAANLRPGRGRLHGLVRTGAVLAPVVAVPVLLFFRCSTGGLTGDEISYAWTVRPLALRTLSAATTSLDVFLWPLVILVVLWIKRGQLRIGREIRLSLWLILLAFLALPEVMMTGAYVASRLVIAVWLVLLAAGSPDEGAPARSPWLTLAIATFIVYRSVILSIHWHSYDRLTGEVTAAFDRLPKDALVFSASTQRFGPGHLGDKSAMQPPIWHWTDLAVLHKQAFVPEMHANPGQQPLTVSGRFADIYAFHDTNPIAIDSGQPDREASLPEKVFDWLGIPLDRPPSLKSVLKEIGDLAEAAGIPPSRTFLLVLDPEALSEGALPGGQVRAKGARFSLIQVLPAEIGDDLHQR